MIIINPIPGQEEQNAEFLERTKIGLWLKKDDNTKEVLESVILNDEVLEQMRKNANKFARKTSTRDICEIILNQ